MPAGDLDRELDERPSTSRSRGFDGDEVATLARRYGVDRYAMLRELAERKVVDGATVDRQHVGDEDDAGNRRTAEEQEARCREAFVALAREAYEAFDFFEQDRLAGYLEIVMGPAEAAEMAALIDARRSGGPS